MRDPVRPVGRLEKIGYGMGDLASSFYLNFFNLYLLFFFVELGGVAPAAMGKRGMQSLEAMGVDAQEFLAHQLGHTKPKNVRASINA